MILSLSSNKNNQIDIDLRVNIKDKNKNIPEDLIQNLKRIIENTIKGKKEITIALTNWNLSCFDAIKSILKDYDQNILIVQKEEGESQEDLKLWTSLKDRSIVIIEDEETLKYFLLNGDKSAYLSIPDYLYLKYFKEINTNPNIGRIIIETRDFSNFSKISSVQDINKYINKIEGISLKLDCLMGTHVRHILGIKDLKSVYSELYKYKQIAEKGKDDLEKFKIAYSLIGKSVSYSFDQDGDSAEDSFSHSIKGAILRKKAVCEGYSCALSQLLNFLNIENNIVIGGSKGTKSITHVWNQVKINGKWYNCDVTNDNENIKEGRTLDYCLLSDEDFFLYEALSKNARKCDVSFDRSYLEEFGTRDEEN